MIALGFPVLAACSHKELTADASGREEHDLRDRRRRGGAGGRAGVAMLRLHDVEELRAGDARWPTPCARSRAPDATHLRGCRTRRRCDDSAPTPRGAVPIALRPQYGGDQPAAFTEGAVGRGVVGGDDPRRHVTRHRHRGQRPLRGVVAGAGAVRRRSRPRARAGLAAYCATVTRVAVVADTHLPRRRRGLPAGLIRECEAADRDPARRRLRAASVLAELQAYGPVDGVLGNCDDLDLAAMLPEQRVVEVDGVRIGMVHDSGLQPGAQPAWRRGFPTARWRSSDTRTSP